MEQRDFLNPLPNPQTQQNLPNATAALVLGILSIVGVFCYGIGFICGIVGLVLANKDRKLYKEVPELYAAASYGTSNAGRICCIIGIILFCLIVVLIVVLISFSMFAFPKYFR